MPKELHEISKFMAGTITVPSETDISDDTASYSINIDPVAEDGILQGVPDDLLAIVRSAVTSQSYADYANGVTLIRVDDFASFSSSGYLYVEDDNGLAMILKYTGKQATNTFNGVTWLGPGTGNIDINDNIYQVADIKADKLAMINDDGTHRVVYFDDVDDKIKKIDDIHGTVGTTATLSSTAETKTGIPTMQVNNKEVHIGMGKGAADKPLWCGIVPHGQFGGSAPAGLQLEDAALTSPSPFTNLTKVFCNDAETKIFGYLIDTAILYRFDIATSSVDLRSAPGLLTYAGSERSIHSACKVDGENMIWVVTAGASDQVIHKVDMDNFEIVFSCQTNLANGTKVMDVIHINADNGDQDFMWFSTGADIYRFVTPSVGESPSPVSKLPDLVHITNGGSFDHTDVGAFIQYDSGWTGANVVIDFKNGSGANSLFRPSDITSSSTHAWVGWLGQIKQSDPTNKDIYFVHEGSCNHTADGLCVGSGPAAGRHRKLVLTNTSGSADYGLIVAMLMRDDFSAGDKLSSDSVDGDIDEGTTGGLVTIDTTMSHAVNGISGTNDDVLIVSVDNGVLSNMRSVVTPAIGELENGEAVAFASSSDSLNLNEACGVCIKDGGTAKFHLFAGSTDARWAYGTFASPAAILEKEVVIDSARVASGGTLANATEYKYKASFMYDGYQESPLTSEILESRTTDGTNQSHTLTIVLRNIGNFRKRVTHLNVYASAGTGFYRLIKSIDITNSWEDTTETSSKPAWGNYKSIIITDNGSYLGSYEAINGISEAIRPTLPNYGLSAQLNNQLFVADCFIQNLTDANLILFKSKPYNFDQFDWSADLLRLPTKPTALASFNGRIYAFDENNTYRIEPNSLYIEDTFEGVGCVGPEAVVVTEYGMCFADKNNIYLHDGRQPVPIGNPILKGDSKSWQNRDMSWASKIIFDAKRNSFVVMFKLGNYYAWVFNISRRRWDLWEMFGIAEPLGNLSGKNGEMFISNSTNLMDYLGSSSTKRSWDWYSKKLTMGQDTQTKVFKRTRIGGNTGDCVDTFVSSEGTPTDSGSTDGTTGYVYNLSGAASRAKWLQYKITSETNTVDAIGTIFRRRPVK